MAANDELPRGWTFTNNASGGFTASIVVPAAAGIVHVLDDFFAVIYNVGATNFGPVVTLTSSDGVFSGFVLANLLASSGSATQASAASDSASGLNLAAGPGASLTVAFSANTTTEAEFLRIQGHDI